MNDTLKAAEILIKATAKKMAYRGRRSCGCVVAVTWINPRFLKDAEADAREYRERGLTVEYVSADIARASLTFCKHN